MFEAIIWVIIYGIIEGITEWLPVSSTGHLIIFESFWQIQNGSGIITENFLEMFRVVIQLGAIMAVVYNYFKRLNPFSSKLKKNERIGVWNTWIKIVIGCVPAGIAGLLLNDFFDAHFYKWQVVAITLVVYGILFVIIERKNKREVSYETMEDIPNSTAFIIGCAQVLSLIPGTSRSGVTILAGLLVCCSRSAAADYTFCMAIPIMAGASFLKGLKYLLAGNSLSGKQLLIMAIGMIVAFFVSLGAVRFLQDFVKKRTFRGFGYYRIILGIALVIIALIFPGVLPGSTKESAYGLPSYVDEQYIDINEFSRPDTPLLQVNNIVVHYTADPGATAQNERDYFNNLAKQDKTALEAAGESATYGSSNFVVGLEGEIIAVVPIDEIAYCSNDRNSDTISIETCHPDETGEFNEKTYASLVKITAWLCDHYGLTGEDVIRHYDVTGKICPKYFVENEEAWETFKTDVQVAIDELSGTTTTTKKDTSSETADKAKETTSENKEAETTSSN